MQKKANFKKQPKLTTLDINPNSFYMAQVAGMIWQPCTIICTSEPGWQRGLVDLDLDRVRATMGGVHSEATAVFFDTYWGSVKVPVVRKHNEDFFRFLGFGDTPTLLPFDAAWIGREMNQAKQTMAEASALIARLTTFKSIYNTRGAQYGWPLAAD